KLHDLENGPGGRDRVVARRVSAVAVIWTLGGCWALKPDGSVLDVPDWEDPDFEGEEVRVVERAQLVRGVQYQASIRFGLPVLAPTRSADAVPCRACGGAGHLPKVPEEILCVCLGLGWQLRDEQTSMLTPGGRP